MMAAQANQHPRSVMSSSSYNTGLTHYRLIRRTAAASSRRISGPHKPSAMRLTPPSSRIPIAVVRWDIAFADLFIAARRRSVGGRPRPWRLAFQADQELPSIVHLLLGMNAHIADLPPATLSVILIMISKTLADRPASS